MNKSLIAALGLGLMILVFRLVPSPDNFSPLLALCLALGFMSRGHWSGFVIPMAAMLIADVTLGFYPGWAFTYIPLVAIVAMGILSQPKLLRMTTLAFSSSVVFFVISNFGVWFSTGMYPKTVAGLGACYLAGLEFFHQTLLSTAVFTGLLFVPLFWALNYSSKRVMD